MSFVEKSGPLHILHQLIDILAVVESAVSFQQRRVVKLCSKFAFPDKEIKLRWVISNLTFLKAKQKIGAEFSDQVDSGSGIIGKQFQHLQRSSDFLITLANHLQVNNLIFL